MKTNQNDNLMSKILIMLLFISLRIISKSYNYNNQSKIDNEIIKNLRILSDTQINTWTANNQNNSKISSLSDGNFVVIWESYNQNGNSWGIFGQIFYSNGAERGSEFPINNYTTSNQSNPKIAASASGKFMVVWNPITSIISGQIFTNNGIKFGSDFQINKNTISTLAHPSITALVNNNFVVIWGENSLIDVQMLADDGTKVGSQFNISNLYYPLVAALADGNFVVTALRWPTGYGVVYAQIFYNNGTKLGTEFVVSTFPTDKSSISISSISNSNFMIVWSSQGQDIIGGTDWGIYGQSFTSSGVKIGNEFRVNTYIIGEQQNPSITSLANGNYIVTWRSNSQDGNGWGVYGQILDSTGKKIGNEFKVNTITVYDQSNPSVSSLINTNFVVVWQSNNQDGSGWGVFGNIFQSDGSVIGFNICPYNCQSCTNSTYCIICNPNFKLESNGLCGCLDGFYLDNISTSLCISKFILTNYLLKSF